MERQKLKWVAGRATSSKVYITRVFNYGTWEEWKRMKRRFTSKEIEDAVAFPLKGQWTVRAKNFAEFLFSRRMPSQVLIRYHV